MSTREKKLTTIKFFFENIHLVIAQMLNEIQYTTYCVKTLYALIIHRFLQIKRYLHSLTINTYKQCLHFVKTEQL